MVLPLSEWQELGARGRSEVREAARSGRRHPDPYVAQLAYAWAQEILRMAGAGRSRRERVAGAGLGAALLAAAAALLGPAAAGLAGGLGSDWQDRRLARALLAIGPLQPQGQDSPEQDGRA